MNPCPYIWFISHRVRSEEGLPSPLPQLPSVMESPMNRIFSPPACKVAEISIRMSDAITNKPLFSCYDLFYVDRLRAAPQRTGFPLPDESAFDRIGQRNFGEQFSAFADVVADGDVALRMRDRSEASFSLPSDGAIRTFENPGPSLSMPRTIRKNSMFGLAPQAWQSERDGSGCSAHVVSPSAIWSSQTFRLSSSRSPSPAFCNAWFR